MLDISLFETEESPKIAHFFWNTKHDQIILEEQ